MKSLMDNYMYFYDTSSILNGNYPEENDYISSTVLRELENIKTSGDKKSEDVKHAARKAARYFLENGTKFTVSHLSEKQWKKISRKYSFLDTPDNKIIAELLSLKEEGAEPIFCTNDVCLYLLANQFNIKTHYTAANEKKGGIYYGYREYEVNDRMLESIYSNSSINCYQLGVNEYAILKQGKEIIDVIRWDGKTTSTLNYKDIKNQFMGLVQPKDIYQKIGFDLLQNRSVPVKLIQGRPGSGKDFVMTAHALDLVLSRKKQKIVFIRNLIDLKDAPQIGYLQGSLEEKIGWGTDCIKDIVGGEDGYNWLLEQNAIEQINLGFIRGRSLGPDYIIYVTEAQNLTESAMQSIISRAAEGTEVWINADLKQIDKKIFQTNNGVVSLQQNLAGSPLFGAVYFPNSHRSKVAELSGLLTSL